MEQKIGSQTGKMSAVRRSLKPICRGEERVGLKDEALNLLVDLSSYERSHEIWVTTERNKITDTSG